MPTISIPMSTVLDCITPHPRPRTIYARRGGSRTPQDESLRLTARLLALEIYPSRDSRFGPLVRKFSKILRHTRRGVTPMSDCFLQPTTSRQQ